MELILPLATCHCIFHCVILLFIILENKFSLPPVHYHSTVMSFVQTVVRKVYDRPMRSIILSCTEKTLSRPARWSMDGTKGKTKKRKKSHKKTQLSRTNRATHFRNNFCLRDR